jgi:hypothetical protein
MIGLLRTCKIKKDSVWLRDFFVSIAHCRDIYTGRGERDLSYRMIYDLYQVFPVLALKALHLMVSENIGSWCDVKYFCLYIEKISPCGFYDPLVEAMIRIANRRLKKDLELDSGYEGGSNVAKWIPRESHHPELFGLFVRDWFRSSSITSGQKKSYRKMIVDLCWKISLNGYASTFSKMIRRKEFIPSCGQKRYSMPSLPIGSYVRAVLDGADSSWIDYEWRKLMKTFPCSSLPGIAVIDIDLGVPKSFLYDALGFACLIAVKMGSGRVLLGGSVPICVDVSSCSGFSDMVQLLWSYCDGRGKSCMNTAMDLLQKLDWRDLRVFVFSSSFDFDRGLEKYILWGSKEVEGVEGMISGSSSGIIRQFLSCESREQWMTSIYSNWYECFNRIVFS